MTGIDRRLLKTTGEVIDILAKKKLPYTYDEVFHMVRQFMVIWFKLKAL